MALHKPTTYKHGTMADFTANWDRFGLDPGYPCFRAARADGAVALVPYSPLFMEQGVDPERYLKQMAHEELARLDGST